MPVKGSAYKTGYRAEQRAVKILKERGYMVIRSAGSKGPFDIIGLKKSEILAVQIKVVPRNKIPSFDKLKEQIRELPVPDWVKKEIWAWERVRGFHFISIN